MDGMTTKLSESQRVLLRAIHAHDGQWNWYKLGRACVGSLDSPADLTLKLLLDAGLIEERPFEGEPLPRLHVTEEGSEVLRSECP